jgi:glycine/D-amino acid oxidase-like deaminating enzyme
VVIGAGLLGVSTAFHLARRGAQVEILERAAPAGGTSASSFARISALHKLPRAYFELNHAGLRAWHDLVRTMPDLPGVYLCGSHVCGDGDGVDGFAQHLRDLAAWGATVRPCEPGDLKPQDGGPVCLAANAVMAALPEEGWVDVPVAANALLQAARQDGQTAVRLGSEVVGIDAMASGLRITLADGNHTTADAVVNAAGPDSGAVARLVGRQLPLSPSRGLLVDLDTADCQAKPAMVEAPQATVRPTGQPARIQARADAVDAELNRPDAGSGTRELDALAHRVCSLVGDVLPAFAQATVASYKVGVRSMPADGYPSIGAVRDIPGYYEAVSHSGVTLGVLLGRLLTEEILTGDRNRLVTPYAPDRFTAAPSRGSESERAASV